MYKRPHGVRHLLAADDLGRDKLYGHIKKRKGRTQFLAFCRYLRKLVDTLLARQPASWMARATALPS